MSSKQANTDAQVPDPEVRPVGGTEHSWCRAVPGGTGVTVLALLLSKPPNLALLQNALDNLQVSHPILRSKLHFDSTTNIYSFVTPATPHVQIQPFDLASTAEIIRRLADPSVSPFHLIVEHEMEQNSWRDNAETAVMFASVYDLSGEEWVVVLRLHTGACDRTAAAAVLRELLGLVGGGTGRELGGKSKVNLGVEDCIPSGKTNKPFWARGVDMLGYSLNSFRLANLNFLDVDSPRRSQFLRLQMNLDETNRFLACCKSRGIGVCGALAAAGLIAACASKNLPDDQWEKYAVVTLIDCRPDLEPSFNSHGLGFYHSAILNTHDIRGGEKLWELANRTYMSFVNAKKSSKHFTDMADLNFLMCRAIENPGLTPSSSLRTSLISVFEDPVIDNSTEMHREIGLEDYVGCASAHGVGPSMAIFETIRDGQLNCPCVYPSPLHSREQVQGLVDDMKRILVDASSCEDGES
ncbi:uncharacterized protein LOC127788489 [Diospyros lotus]|uniref:uncharacterized protein LOC127788489 n=1 Tax=Diospyros lotus TaxID=55363 RepID=UPI0022560227|nr:uncharacterized protein LOC127788489 [Diospyros lotus]